MELYILHFCIERKSFTKSEHNMSYLMVTSMPYRNFCIKRKIFANSNLSRNYFLLSSKKSYYYCQLFIFRAEYNGQIFLNNWYYPAFQYIASFLHFMANLIYDNILNTISILLLPALCRRWHELFIGQEDVHMLWCAWSRARAFQAQ